MSRTTTPWGPAVRSEGHSASPCEQYFALHVVLVDPGADSHAIGDVCPPFGDDSVWGDDGLCLRGKMSYGPPGARLAGRPFS